MVAIVLGLGACAVQADELSESAARPTPAVQHLVRDYCLDCHSGEEGEAGLDLEPVNMAALGDHRQLWEKVIRKLRARQMPPAEAPRPDEASYNAALGALEQSLGRLAAEDPRPGRTDTFRRLTRTEYQNAIRDLLALEIDTTTMLPMDKSSHGFDNVTVGALKCTRSPRPVSVGVKTSKF